MLFIRFTRFVKSVDGSIGAKNLHKRTSLHQIFLDHLSFQQSKMMQQGLSLALRTYQPNLHVLLFLYFWRCHPYFPLQFLIAFILVFVFILLSLSILYTGYYIGNAYMPSHKLVGIGQVLLHVHTFSSSQCHSQQKVEQLQLRAIQRVSCQHTCTNSCNNSTLLLSMV